MEKFKGASFHTSRWNYNIDLLGKTVGIIGTGATAIQAIPELAKIVGQLYVFQRHAVISRRARPARHHGRRAGDLG